MKRMQQTTTTRHDSIAERLRRFRGFIILVSVPLLLISFVLLFMPRIPNSITLIDDLSRNSSSNSARKSLPSSSSSSSRGSKSKSYAVIFDAGSSGSRVHVYCFDRNLDLVPIGDDLELFVQKKPGLSSFAENPKEAANSLKSLLEKAESVIPKSLLKITPVRVGATAGLRALPGDTSQKILQAVHEFLVDQSSLKSAPDSVTILDGTQEGSFQWVTINYLLGNLGKDYSDTVGVVDLGGGSVQMAYAISEKDAKTSPRLSDGQDTYVRELFLKGTKYYLYVHSYLNYGLLAARAEILKAFESHSHPCVLQGFEGTYHYGGSQYKVAAMPSGSSYKECRAAAIEALKVNDTCTYLKCTFGGTWNGGGGDGQVNLFVASFFFDRAVEAGFIDDKNPIVKVRPVDFENAAKRACGTTFLDAKALYVNVEENNLPYFCMDLVYQYTLLVDGFALDPQQQITLVKKVKYKGLLVEAAWPLGSAIEVASAA